MISVPEWFFIVLSCFGFLGIVIFLAFLFGLFSVLFTKMADKTIEKTNCPDKIEPDDDLPIHLERDK